MIARKSESPDPGSGAEQATIVTGLEVVPVSAAVEPKSRNRSVTQGRRGTKRARDPDLPVDKNLPMIHWKCFTGFRVMIGELPDSD